MQTTLTLKIMLSTFPHPFDLEIKGFFFPGFAHLMYFRAAILLKSIEALVWVSATQDEKDLHYQALKLFAC